MRYLIVVLAAATLFLGVAAFGQKAQTAQSASPFKPTATIQEIMESIVDPSADALWASVGSVSTKAGTEERQPRTDEEWKAVRHHAIALIEGANLLVMEGRQVATEGKKLEDSHVAGILDPQEIQKAIDANWPSFIKAAHRLHAAGTEALGAIDARNPTRLMAAGDRIDQACEQCHSTYWYPNDTRPTEKWPAPLNAVRH